MDTNREKLIHLQSVSSDLEPEPAERDKVIRQVQDYAHRFLDSLNSQKAYNRFGDSVKSILDDALQEDPEDISSLVHEIENRIIPPGLNPASGSLFGYIPGGGLYSSAAGDFITAITNRYAGVYYSSPGAVALETRLVNWMAGLIGYGKEAGGYLASGGSIANLTAMVAAREQAGLKSQDFPDAVIYLSEQTHHCIDRALNIAGMGECVKRYVPLNDRFEMRSDLLAGYIKKDRENGLRPWMIVGNAGTTNTGAVDPLNALGDLAASEKLWYHVDAAYGGFFLLTAEGREKLKGIERADSVVLDPHKGLFMPYGSGALVVKDVRVLAASHRFEAGYMQDTLIEKDIYSPAEISPELSKHFRGLRMWLPLRLHGVKAFRAALEEKMLLARYCYDELSNIPGIETGPEPDLSIFTFRWAPEEKENHDQLNKLLHEKLTDDGRIFVSTTSLKGRYWFRFAVLSVRSHLKEVDRFLEIIRETTKALGRDL